MSEHWKDVVGHEGFYRVSNKGRVLSLPRTVERGNRWGTTSIATFPGKELTWSDWPSKFRETMPGVHLCSSGKNKVTLVKRIVFEAFSGVKLHRGVEVYPIDGDQYNCDFSNLAIRVRGGRVAKKSTRKIVGRGKQYAKERFAYVPGFGTRYMVSSEGRIFSSAYGDWRERKLNQQAPGRSMLCILIDGDKKKTFVVKNLVWEVFSGRPIDGFEVLPADGDDTNCRFANLIAYALK